VWWLIFQFSQLIRWRRGVSRSDSDNIPDVEVAKQVQRDYVSAKKGE